MPCVNLLKSLFYRELCQLVDVEELYRAVSDRILEMEDLAYRRRVVDMMNAILLTSPEAFPLRTRLKLMETTVRTGKMVPSF